MMFIPDCFGFAYVEEWLECACGDLSPANLKALAESEPRRLEHARGV